jgi:DHA3 family tetracycline resistance protein-like MFS transporter
MLRPLRDRDFRLLWAGMTVSLLGDGVYVVAVAWQAYDVSNSPAALAVTGIAWTLPTVLLLPFGGTLSDRIGRRPLMICADLLRAAAVGVIAVLSLTGHLEIWHLVVLSAMFGVGEALFGPSFTALVPEIVPKELLLEANAIDQTMRPLAFQFAGPALGGLLVGVWGAGSAFALNAVTFLVSAACVALMRRRRRVERESEGGSMLDDMREGLAYARGQTWLWGTLIAFSVAVLAFWGPWEVLVPFVIKNHLEGGAGSYGVVLAAGGLGSIVGAVIMGNVGMPPRRMAVMYACFIVSSFAIVFYGLAGSVWQIAIVAAAIGACFAVGIVIWGTLMQSLVPNELLGRVSAIDWMVSTALAPLSFALVGPLSSAIGARETLVGAGLVSGVVLLAFYVAIPGMRDIDRSEA